MGDEANQKKIFAFLSERYRSREMFTRKELFAGTVWKKKSQDTYFSKQIRQFFDEPERNSFVVKRSFRPYLSWEKFRKHIVTQTRKVTTSYKSEAFASVLIFEAPLTLVLDELFYRDTLQASLKAIRSEDLHSHFPRQGAETEAIYIDRLCSWLADRFGGYSVFHVNGRFRAGPLMTVEEAAQALPNGDRYLIDETTAVVRFIVPCGRPQSPVGDQTVQDYSEEHKEEAIRVNWFFEKLFVQSILEAVNGEAEIWMVESGMYNRLHVWKKMP
jgi:hypothetical protein